MSAVLRKPTCVGCPHDLHFGEFVSKKQYGVMMHCGEHFCTGGKRARRFRRSDPKVSVPEWCPRRKSPCELRLYGFKDKNAEALHYLLCAGAENTSVPPAHRYALKRETHTELQPAEFWSRCEMGPYSDLLGFKMNLYEVLEIDDGLEPAFFYMTEKGLVLEPYFDAERARKNAKENLFEGRRKALRHLPVLLSGAGAYQEPGLSAPEVQQPGLQHIDVYP